MWHVPSRRRRPMGARGSSRETEIVPDSGQVSAIESKREDGSAIGPRDDRHGRALDARLVVV